MFNRDRGNSLAPPFSSSNAVPWNLQLQTEAVLHPFDVNGNPEPAPVLPPDVIGVDKFFGTPPDNANGLVPAADYIFHHSPPRAPFSILPGLTSTSMRARIRSRSAGAGIRLSSTKSAMISCGFLATSTTWMQKRTMNLRQ